MSARLGWWAGCAAIGLSASVCAQPVVSPPSERHAVATIDQQTDAIRRALLAETLKKQVRVVSKAWLDEQGRLREHAQFTSDLKVRGVRVSSYIREGDEVQAQLQWNPGAVADKTVCDAAPAEPRRPVTILTGLSDIFEAGERSVAAGLLVELGAALRSSSADHPWYVRAPQWSPQSSYERHFVGAAATNDPWSMELTLEPLPQSQAQPDPTVSVHAALARWGVYPWQPSWRVRLRLRWVDRDHPERSRVWSEDVHIAPITAVDRGHDAMALIRQALGAALQRGVQDLHNALLCEPMAVSVTLDGDGLSMPLGTQSGVRSGDRWVVMSRAQLPHRVLEPQALDSVGLAEVRRVGASSAQLHWLGGAPPRAVGDWVAVPVDLERGL